MTDTRETASTGQPPVPQDRAPDVASPAGRPARLGVILALWAALLVAGFGLVLALGSPLAEPIDELAAAYAPAKPVTEATARNSAATIVRLEFPEFAAFEPSVERVEGFATVQIPRWVIVYADPGGATGVRVSITEAEGTVEVSTFP